ncbi:hypothetical protein PF004_g25438 [Phytophthora fragariae]|uniref:START domain-containing protein n=1 Tax=Phytophthora fragariae TaxID=53985 RepID=A0A6G0MSP8_9STRA|nr:hypothetical protein PF004_g25438 [Phytophthora fragariae]
MGTPSSPFGPVRLSCIDTARLQELVRLLVHEHTLGYEQFVHEDQRLVDPTQWKRNAQRDNLQVYCRQQQQRKNSSAGERGSRRRLFRDTEVRTALTEMPTLLLVGTIKGSLADVMYGVLNPTADSMRLKSSYVGDKFAGCAVLATIERPTPSDPFRSHSLKWLEGDHPFIFRPIVKNRDFVFMEATGLIHLAGGERQSDGVVEVFTKTTANPGGHVAPAIAVKFGANALLSAQNLVDCAHAKKLAWAVSSRAHSTSTTSSSSSSSTSSSATSSTREFRAHSGGICPAGVKKSLRFVAWTGDVAKHKMKFCGPCVSEATNLDARALACDEFGADRPSEHHLNHKNRLTAHLEGLTTSDPNVVVLRPSALSS